jgi:hypothetical protein
LRGSFIAEAISTGSGDCFGKTASQLLSYAVLILMMSLRIAMYLKGYSCIPQTLLFSILALILFAPRVVYSEDVILAWDRPDDARVTGYKIFYGLEDSDFTSAPKKTIDSPDITSCDIFNLKEGRTYGFAAKSIDGKGNESEFSEVIYYDVPGTPDDPDDPEDPDDPNDPDDPDDDKSSGGGGGGCFINIWLKK